MKTPVSDELSLDEQLCFALYRASQAIVASYREHLAEVGLTYTQYLVMLVLWESGTSSVGQMSTRLGLDSGTLTPLLKRLEQRGLVTRERAAKDERVVQIGLTRSGRATYEPVLAARRKVAADTGLTSSELARLRGELHRLSDHMEH
ncbi:MAG: MarR family transcriptional regulator [Gammaproteobacteria bacterium]|jgi:DNA-binding MarR family transcriptional regulator|nr:MarR family transcriptional regulator [Gammaproteobacteria bacterium]